MANWHGKVLHIILAATIALFAACGPANAPETEVEEPGLAPGEIVERPRSAARAAARRDRLRQNAAADAAPNFEFIRYRIDVADTTPQACFIFSSPLDPATDYSPFIEFHPALTPAFSIEGQELCASGLRFGETWTVLLKSGLPGGEGNALSQDEEVPIHFEDRPAYVGFKGSGVILPRLDADGLPIETINVDDVRITVGRVGDRALAFKSIDKGRSADQGRGLYLYGNTAPYDVQEELWTGTMPVAAVRNTPVVTVFPLADVIGELKPGSYFVRVEDAKPLPAGEGPPAASVRWIMMTDLALTAYRGEHGLDVTLRSLQTSQAIQAARVELIARNNSILAEGRTGPDGRIRFARPLTAGLGNTAPRLILAYGDAGDLAVLDLQRPPVDLATDTLGGRRTRGDIDTYAYTDRGIYRPGERVQLTALLRQRDGTALGGRPGTLIFHRPNGLEADRERFTELQAGGLTHTYMIPRDAARGLWRAAVHIDGAGRIGEVQFAVEDFIPQRIAVELDSDQEHPVLADETRDVTAHARFLYGAPGAGLIVKSQIRVEVDPSPFEGFEGFTFGSPGETFRERLITLPDQVADGAGTAILRLNPRGAGLETDRPLRLNTVVDVLEPGGRAVSESIRLPYRPQATYLGTRAKFEARAREGAPAEFEVAAVSAAGETIGVDLSWTLLAIDHHYDWFRENGEWRWRRSRTVRAVNEGYVSTSEGATGTITVNGLDWGTYELRLRDSEGHKTARQFTVGWGGINDEGVEAPDRVAVFGPDTPPRAGGETEIAILPPFDGEAQIVVATDRVIQVLSQPVSKDGTRITLPVTGAWGEGAYVMVTVHTPRDAVRRAKPRRAVGIAHVPVNMDERTFNLSINTREDVLLPGREHLITVNIDNGPREPVFLTLAAVDEGILRLTKFDSPNPVAHFFGKKALGVDLLDDYGRLLNPNLGLPTEVRTGGDQLGGEGLSVVPVKSVALFSGLVEVGRSGRASVRFEVPPFNGEFRLMAVAWSQTGLGAASRTVTVRDAVPTELILPRFMAPGDEALATASIDNVSGEAGAYAADLTTEGAVMTSAGTVTRDLLPGQRVDGPIRISSNTTGISDITLSVRGPGGYAIERAYQIETRSAFLPVSLVSQTRMDPGETWSPPSDIFAGFIPGSADLTVSFSHLPMDAGALYSSLARYPYGCSEQTVSRALPLLYAEQLAVIASSRQADTSARDQVQSAINRLLNRQSADGAFGLWREGDRQASPWLGAYMVDFLARAKAENYAVPDEALSRAYTGLRTIAEGNPWRIYGYDTEVWEDTRWHTDTVERLMHRAAAYALYVLARDGQADVARLRYLHDTDLSVIESPLAQAHLAAGLAHMGDRARAANAFRAALETIGYTNSGDYYQTPLRDLAGILALAAETGFNDIAADLARRIGTLASDPNTLTTQEKAFLLLAVNAVTGGTPEIRMDVQGLEGQRDSAAHYRLNAHDLRADLAFTLRGDTPLFRTVIARGAPIAPPPAAAEKLRIQKSIHSLRGETAPLNTLRRGDQFVIRLEITPEENRTNPVIIADLLPAGFEIETVLRPADGAQIDKDDGAFSWVGRIDKAKSAEGRDDRFLAAIDVRDTAVTLAYIVRAITPGDFTLPGAYAEDMYRPDVFARSTPGRVTILPQTVRASGAQ